MEVGALFLLVILVVAIGAAGLAVFAFAARQRRRQLDPEGDRAEHAGAGADGGEHPEHVRVRDEQRARLLTHR